MKRIMQWLAPKEKKFFEMLAEQSQNVLEASKELKIFVDDYSNLERGERKTRAYVIKRIEQKGDDISKRIFEMLNKDIRMHSNGQGIKRTAVLLDDIADLINAVASRFVILGIERIDKPMLKLIDIANAAVIEVNKIILNLKKLKKMEEQLKVYDLEREADDIYHEALSELFHFHKHSIDIIKYKEIYELLEAIIDKCKDVSNAVEDIVAKHS